MHLPISITAIFCCILLFTQCTRPPNETLINGDKVPNISLPNAQGKTIDLTQLEGKMVLIDFWASWCAPCRDINPELTELYHRFKDVPLEGGKQGFIIYSASLDTKVADWQKAALDDGITWPTSVIDTLGFGSPVREAFAFSSIPTSYLINSKGVIVGKNLTIKWLTYELERRANKMKAKAVAP